MPLPTGLSPAHNTWLVHRRCGHFVHATRTSTDCIQHIIQTYTHLWHFSDHVMTTHLNKVTGNGKKNALGLRLAEVIVATDCLPAQPAHVTATRAANHLVTAETSPNTDVKLMCTQ